jgi:probable F420-dependent oxidoreductase
MPTSRIDPGRVGIWTGTLDGVSSAEAQQAAVRAEAMGFPTIWIPETVGRDPFITATLLLSATSTLKVATGIANIYARDALTMANTQRSLEEAFPGRFLLGLGVSHQVLVDTIRHHSYDKPYSRMAAYLDEMDAAIFMGHGPTERPKPVLAALGPRMLALSGERAGGAHTYFVPPEHTATAREILGAEPLLAPEQMVVLDTDRDRAHAVARQAMSMYLQAPNYVNNLKRLGFNDDDVAGPGSDRLVDAIVVWGDADTIRQRVQEHFDAGADHVCVQALRADAAVPEEAWQDLSGALAETGPKG